MVRHVLAIYRPCAAGDAVLRRARGLVGEHGARLTVAVTTTAPGPPCGCAISGTRWDQILRAEAERELCQARRILDRTPAHLTVIAGVGPQVIADAANRLGCDVVLVPAGRRLARRLRRRTPATVLSVRRG